MDYLCAKFGDLSLSRFWFYRADRITESQTDRITRTERRMIATYATTRSA